MTFPSNFDSNVLISELMFSYGVHVGRKHLPFKSGECSIRIVYTQAIVVAFRAEVPDGKHQCLEPEKETGSKHKLEINHFFWNIKVGKIEKTVSDF